MKTRIEKDSMGEIKVPQDALYAAQTQRAVNNFNIGEKPMPIEFIRNLALLKKTCAIANNSLQLLSDTKKNAICEVADKVYSSESLADFPIDIYQTGSGTSTNMNMNEVLASMANKQFNIGVHPNDDINMSQSSNDVIPTSLALTTTVLMVEKLMPALKHLADICNKKARETKSITKNGRTHLMDAMPITIGQEVLTWQIQIEQNIKRLEDSLPRIADLPIGGTAVGTGINAHPKFGELVAKELSQHTKIKFTSTPHKFIGISSQDSAVEVSSHLRTCAVTLLKIANDLRLMNSGPLAGFADIQLEALQPGSSIMPGKVNPVIPEAVAMASMQVIGLDTAIAYAGSSGLFQLNVTLPLIANNLVEMIRLVTNSAKAIADKAISTFIANEEHINVALSINPILVTALNQIIGYEKGAQIAKQAYKERRPIIDIAKENTDLTEAELKKLLNPLELTKGGIKT